MVSDTSAVSELARKIRVQVLRMIHKAKASHVGTSLSIADILAVLYGSVLQIQPTEPESPDRDRLIVSKGHSAAAVYAVLAETGFYPRTWLDTYCQDGSRLAGHVTRGVPGVEASTGSLGHGLAIGCGMALGAKRGQNSNRVFVLMSDGECDEGGDATLGLNFNCAEWNYDGGDCETSSGRITKNIHKLNSKFREFQ